MWTKIYEKKKNFVRKHKAEGTFVHWMAEIVIMVISKA